MTVNASKKKPKTPRRASSTGIADDLRPKNKTAPLSGGNSRSSTTVDQTMQYQISPAAPSQHPVAWQEQLNQGHRRGSSTPPPPYTLQAPLYSAAQLSQSMSALDISSPAIGSPQPYPYNPRPQTSSPQQNQHQPTAGHMNQAAALVDILSTKMNSVITAIDGEVFGGREEDLVITNYPPVPPAQAPREPIPLPVDPRRQNFNLPHAVIPSSNYFAKVWHYSNARLPPSLPPLKLYMPTYPILCLAAQYSLRAYSKPHQSSSASISSTATESTQYIDANWRLGTKAMVLKTHSLDERNCIVFAIRGSQTFMDWAVNFRQAPSAPAGFLDDAGNLVHSGFLQVARAMVAPIAQRLRELLQENPARATASLLLTGHSAGGAVASLLYCHMLSQSAGVASELKALTGFFKRVHCVTFGAPPVSLLPLQRSQTPALRKSLFLAFLNEGDPVVRADSAFVRSLLALYANPLPPSSPPPAWPVPQNQLSNAGRLVVMRPVAPPVKRSARRGGAGGSGTAAEEYIEACVTSDEQLRGVVFGDPLMHMMRVYARRIETLAVGAVTAGVYGDR